MHHFIGISATPEVASAGVAARLDMIHQYNVLPDPRDMHITLLFLGGFEFAKVEELWDRIATIPSPSFPLTFSKRASFGLATRPRVLFLAPEHSNALLDLQAMVRKSGDDVSFEGDRRPYHPHMTIAKKWRGVERTAPLDDIKIKPVTMTVAEIHLYEIRIGEVPRYERIQTKRLE
ncbi:RNA 2',3'-cyclic phosphodiesterase [Paenalkalicoccus suaedae]|uniref:RNA 2',3'-cyclic phosphodiesterase n=1 Tax=Paenalkalicoccus suaedae TaxID=2592382 RepID=A0A859FG45_9BACI|nr:RNA 2',3'-cyclic phosphodiesterase [Paenalkalicoccus suaedae]QKS72109.1 RNA 2',3'-cyclic phosphodiesterase [Paenalkalicoccus suaedae]